MKIVKRSLWIVLGIFVLLVAGFFAVGKREGIAVLYVKYVMRHDPEPNRPVTWQAGPDQPAANKKKQPNIILIVADDLGYNDITLRHGGVAGGSVPTRPPRTRASAVASSTPSVVSATWTTCPRERRAVTTWEAEAIAASRSDEEPPVSTRTRSMEGVMVGL